MFFTIALYGSFRDTSGYAWKLPSGHDKSQLENIFSLLNPPDDGRKLGGGELHGGYYIDVSKDLVYAFRFTDGGRDALGRAGTVMTNCAIARYSELAGMNLKLLFLALTFRQMPLGESVEIALQTAFGPAADTALLATEHFLQGEAAERVFQLPATRSSSDVVVRFTMNDNVKEASVKLLPPATGKPRTWHPRKEPSNKTSSPALRNFLRKILFFIMLATGIGFAAIIFSEMLNHNWIRDTPPAEPIDNNPFKNMTKITVCTSLPATCSWEKATNGNFHLTKNNVVSDKKNLYRWGELSISKSEIIIAFAPNVGQEKHDDALSSRIQNAPLGTLRILNDGWEIAFSKDSQQQHELSGEYQALFNGRVCARLSIKIDCIKFTKLPDNAK